MSAVFVVGDDDDVGGGGGGINFPTAAESKVAPKILLKRRQAGRCTHSLSPVHQLAL